MSFTTTSRNKIAKRLLLCCVACVQQSSFPFFFVGRSPSLQIVASFLPIRIPPRSFASDFHRNLLTFPPPPLPPRYNFLCCLLYFPFLPGKCRGNFFFKKISRNFPSKFRCCSPLHLVKREILRFNMKPPNLTSPKQQFTFKEFYFLSKLFMSLPKSY
jgi:hypothetical protein